MGEREFDIVIFGATGITGKYVFEELVRTTKNEKIKFALAGRNEDKLKAVVEDSKKYLESAGETVDDEVPFIIADIDDENSLLEMCRRTKVVLNCVGPYNLYGEQVVKACVASGTHHFDVSGEPLYLEKMQLQYHEEAKEKGVYIVGACGFDSIPCDLGVTLIKKKFQGDLNSVETFLEMHIPSEGRPVNTGTWNSIVHGFPNASKLRPVRKALNEKVYPKKIPKYSYPAAKRLPLFKSEIISKWCVPFPGSDKTVTYRSQLFNYNTKNERPTQIKTYISMTLLQSLLIMISGIFLFVLSHFKFGRSLLKSYPKLFSLGMFQEGGPTRQQMKDSSFTMTYWAEGWKDKLDPEQQHTEPPNKFMKVVLTAPDVAYITTSICLVNAGLVCLKESDKMPGSGGVLTPGAAFEDTSLLERLQKSGMEFNIMEK